MAFARYLHWARAGGDARPGWNCVRAGIGPTGHLRSVRTRAFAARLRTHVDPNKEMVGLGAANLATGFFQGFPISSSSSRTPVAEAAGARTQLTCVVGALAIAVLLLVGPNLLQHLPTAALAAVVIAAAIGLFEVADLGRIYRIQQWEFWLHVALTMAHHFSMQEEAAGEGRPRVSAAHAEHENRASA